MDDDRCKAAMNLAAKGWHVVKIHGMTAGGGCTCGGAECPSAGKHPVGTQWQNQATTDEDTIAAWFEDGTPWNIGVRLGPTSGIVDVEADDEQAMEVIRRFGLDQIDTPAYRGSRGPHYLFRYDAGLPNAGVVKVDGLEVRIGGGEKATQSVFPPSRHRSGVTYDWLPGRGPDDCEPAPLPEEFKKAILGDQAAGTKAGGCAQRAREMLSMGGKVRAGGRHDFLLGFVCDQFVKEPVLDEECRRRVFEVASAMNVARCDPPKDPAEVEKIVRDQLDFYQRARRVGRQDLRGDEPGHWEQLDAERTPLERIGLIRTGNGNGLEYEPGDWRLTIEHGDPVRYVLTLLHPRTAKSVEVTLTSSDWMNPKQVAAKILEQSGEIDVTDPTPTAWATVWNGYAKDGRVVRGLKCKLFDPPFVQHTYPPPEEKRYAVLASLLLDFIGRTIEPDGPGADAPNPEGTPKWVTAGARNELWFGWDFVWRKVAEQYGSPIAPAEIRDLSKRIRKITKEVDFNSTCRRPKGGATKRYLRWTRDHFEALEQIAGVAGEAPPPAADAA
jgi:hypothetical protein